MEGCGLTKTHSGIGAHTYMCSGFPRTSERVDSVATQQVERKWRGCVVAQKTRIWTKIKKSRGQGAGNTPTALTRPIPKQPEGGQAVTKPMASLYATHGGLAVTSPCRHVVNLTVLVVDPW